MKEKISIINKNFKYFFPILFKKHKLLFLIFLLNVIVKSLSNLIIVFFPAKIIDLLMNKKSFNEVILFVLLFLISEFFLNFINNCCNIYKSKKLIIIDKEIDDRINDKMIKVKFEELESSKFLDDLTYASKCINDYSDGIFGIYNDILTTFYQILTLISIITTIVISKLYFIVPVVIIIVILNAIIVRSNLNLNRKFSEVITNDIRKNNYYCSNIYNFSNQKILRLYDNNEIINKYKNKYINEYLNEYHLFLKKTGNNYHMFSFFDLIYKILVILILVLSFYINNYSIALITLIFNASNSMNNSLTDIIVHIQNYYNNCIYQSFYIDFVTKKDTCNYNGINIDEIKSIEFKNVYFKYPNKNDFVLENVSFKIGEKSKVSLIGVNGSGKTTLIKLLCGFYRIDSGEILINGININELNYLNYLSQLSVVFQDYSILSYTIKENIEIKTHNENMYNEAIIKSDLYDTIQSLSNKDNTYINKWFDKKGVIFSGGELQKIAIARCLYKKSSFIILDEPTSNLDAISEYNLYKHINEVVDNKLTLFISHRLSSCRLCDLVIVMDSEKICEIGTHDNLMKKKGLYYKLFSEQAKYYN